MYDTTHKAMGSGVMIDLANPSPSDIRLDDICHSLSGINRWNGTTDNFYSVASHSLLVGHLFLKARPEATGIELAMALLHDAQEAYVGDVSTPMKSTMKRHAWSRDPECDFERAEHHVVLAIVEHFGILKYFEDHKIDAHHEVIETLKQADRDAAWMESWALFGVDFSPEWRRPQPRGRVFTMRDILIFPEEHSHWALEVIVKACLEEDSRDKPAAQMWADFLMYHGAK